MVAVPVRVGLALGLVVLVGCGRPHAPSTIASAEPIASTEPTTVSTVWIEMSTRKPGGPHRDFVLRRDAQQVVDTLDDLPALGPSDWCHDDAGPTTTLVVHTDDREVDVVAEAFGCQPVTGWGEDRSGGRALHDLVLELLERQRIDPPQPGATPGDCPTPLWSQLTIWREPIPHWDSLTVLSDSAVGPPYAAAAVRLCRYLKTGDSSAPDRSLAIEGAAAETLRLQVIADLTLGAAYPCPLETARADVLVFADGAGGSFEVRLSQDECHGIALGGPTYASGTASPELLAAIDELLA